LLSGVILAGAALTALLQREPWRTRLLRQAGAAGGEESIL